MKIGSKGFTLIETLIYIAIVSIVMVSFISFALSVSGLRNKNYSVATTQANSRMALEMMTKKIRSAQNVISPSAGLSDNQLMLAMPAGPNIIFSVSGNRLQMDEVGIGITNITGVRTKISNLTFTNLSAAGERENIRIEFTADYNATGGGNEYAYTEQLRTAVGLRQ